MGILTKIHNYIRYRKWNRKIQSLISQGAEIGKNIAWFSTDITLDASRPFLLHIGDYCKITKGVIILTHDYSLSVMRRVYGDWVGEGKETYIGDNCFIGMNSIILMGSHIGNNCIIGAGSVVHGSFPDNVVIAGNPARIISSLDDHYQKRCKKKIEEAIDCAKLFKKRMNKNPTPADLINFRFLFTPRTNDALVSYGVDSFECNGDDSNEVRKAFFDSTPYWANFNEFIKEIEK